MEENINMMTECCEATVGTKRWGGEEVSVCSKCGKPNPKEVPENPELFNKASKRNSLVALLNKSRRQKRSAA